MIPVIFQFNNFKSLKGKRIQWNEFFSYFISVSLILFLPVMYETWLDYEYIIFKSTIAKLLFGAAFVSLISFVFSLVIFILRFRIIKYFGWFVIFLFSFFQFVHLLWFGINPSSSVFSAIFATNFGEAKEFTEMYFKFSNLVLSLLYLGALFLIAFLFRWIRNTWFVKVTGALGALYAILVSLVFPGYVFHPDNINRTAVNIINGISDYYAELNKVRELKKEISNKHINAERRNSFENEGETYVVLIGESVDRNNMSAYGYNRNTTPNIDSSGFFVVKDAVSVHTHTIEALMPIFVNRNEKGSYSLLQLAKSAGFETYWLSNQPLLGAADSPIGVLASTADSLISINFGQDRSFDKALLPHLENILNKEQQRKVIFLHLYGSHGPYYKRIPEYYKPLSEKDLRPSYILNSRQRSILNAYDNSIRYTDDMIGDIKIKLEKSKGLSGLMYFSDHGEEVYDFRNFYTHHAGKINKHTVEVPFVFWFNTNYKKKFIDSIHELDSNLNKAFTFRQFPSTYMDFIHVYDTEFKSEESLFSNDFQSYESRMVAGVSYENELSPILNGYESDSIFNNQVWAHRMNSLEEYDDAINTFEGIEIDLVFMAGTNTFDVRHPPAKSKNLSLEDYFRKLANFQGKYIWLDIKNFDQDNSEKIFERIDGLAKKYRINSSQLLIESLKPEGLKIFTQNGYITSFYLPDIDDKNYSQVLPVMEKAKKMITKGYVTGISQSLEDILLAKQYLPNVPKFTWFLFDNSDNIKKEAKRIVNENRDIKVILVTN